MGRKTKMNSITSPELLAQVNPENTQLLEDFKDYLRSIQRSETTIAGYENDIQIAFVWCLQHNNNTFFVNWTKRNIVAYQNWLLNSNENSPARIRRLKAALSSMSNFIESVLDDEFPNFRNIINKVENPVNRPVREKTVWEDSELEALLEKLVERKDYEKPAISLSQCTVEEGNPNYVDSRYQILMRINWYAVGLCIKALQSKLKAEAVAR